MHEDALAFGLRCPSNWSLVSSSSAGCGLVLRFIVAFTLCLVAAACAPVRVGQITALSCKDPLGGLEALPVKQRQLLDAKMLKRFYATSPDCIWSKTNERILLAALDAAPAQGFSGDAFHAAAIRRAREPAAQELLMTDAALRYARAMRRGRVAPARLARDVDITLPGYDPAQGLRGALAANTLAAWLRNLPPAQPGYRRLVDAYARYRELEAAGGWSMLNAPGKAVKPGEQSAILPALQQRLIAEGELAPAHGASVYERLEGPLLDALKHFQRRHGLEADGALGAKTIAALNVSAAARADQIGLNLERWRVLSGVIEPTRFEVNAAAATAALYVDGAIVLDMRVIVGAEDTPTPILMSEIDTVTINPSWVVPFSIVRKEILPAIKRDPDYLVKHEMNWQEGQLVQAPGEMNSLGRLKFEMPSAFSVYLHDTPARRLFARDERAISHGCIRLEKPLDLAEILLTDNTQWTRPDIEKAIEEGATQHIPVNPAMPVDVFYWTSFVDPDGTVEFRNDIYGRDARLAALLGGIKPIASQAASTKLTACRA